MKALMIVALVAATLPIAAGAQSVATAGDRIRIRQTDGSSVVGTVVEASDSQMRLLGPGGEFVVARDEIRTLERSRGEGRAFAKNFFVTTGAGALVFGFLSAATFEQCSGFCIGPTSTGEAFTWGVVGGGILSMPIGVIVGLVVKGERWDRLFLPRPANVALSFAPVRGGGFAFRASIPVGGRRR
ncbi:MAG: hypothetical protein EXR91_01645 [Gemmatimonadetes bacterium]|nr:hypothetical protein [Gemmatimonadota bacterium]